MKKRYSAILFSFMLVLYSQLAWAQQVIQGKVTDENQGPLPGVTVILKGTTTGTSTDAGGNFALRVPDGNGTLVFSFIGYSTQEVPINNRSSISISMAPDARTIDEVVVTALGIKKEQRALGYATSTVSAKQLTEAGNTNFASALYGKAAGVKITTAPGGATSGVNVQIRGINSLQYNTQPLYVVDGVLIRNNNERGAAGANNGGYWNDQRIRGNGVLDINPADIESLTVLKGASATALYGSDAASGVIVITTKKGTKGKGLGVDVNYTYTVEDVAFTPKYQNIYGPGYDRETNLAVGGTAEGWIPVDLDGDGTKESLRPNFRAYGQFGPKMEGQMVPWWDGSMHPFSPQPDNYKNFYQTGYNSIANAAISNQTDKVSYRLSYTRYDYKAVQRGSNMNRNTFNLNSNVKLNDKVNADVVVNYINSYVKNRPMQINRLTASYDGFLGRSEDMSVWLDKYKTSAGYKYVLPAQSDRNPEEALAYNIRPEILNFLWTQLRNKEEENEDRLITSATLNYDISNHFRFRGRVGNDFTSRAIEGRQYTEYPNAFNTPTGSTGYYGTSKGRYATYYGDALLTYTDRVGEDLEVTLNGGVQGRRENYRDQSSGTTSGLITENWFSLNNSYGLPSTSASRAYVTKYAYLGTLSLNYKDFLYVEGTGRQEYTSTLPPANNSYFYPSVNAGFVFTDAFRLPLFLSYGKLRASYGVVGNAPPYYEANVTYSQNPLQSINGSVPSLSAQATFGNESLKSENKYEAEFGLETRILNDKLGLDISYYNSRVENQILSMALPSSVGATRRISNIGEIRSKGWELALNATPVEGTFTWDTRLNFAVNRSMVHSLNEGLDELLFYDAEQSAVRVVAKVGETIGDIYVYPRATDDNGNFIIDNGYYVIDKTRYEKAGNILPKAVGGLSNTLRYKNFSLDFLVDYRFGGQIISTPLKYATGAGMFENTLQYRDEEHGGLPYYIDATNTKVLLPNHTTSAPDGSTVYHDGVLLEGVTTDGAPNTTVLDAASYYLNTFGWGNDAWNKKGSVFDNSYVKMRELSLGYNLPSSFAQKFKFQNLRLSLIGRNLFYFWRTLENLDPEAPIGTQWYRQGIDEGSSAATRSYGIQINASF